VKKRGLAVGIVYVCAFVLVGVVGYLFVPPLVDQINEFVHKLPGYIDDLTKGRGKLGFLETKYHIVEKVKHALNDGGASKLFGLSGTAISIT
jgi:predicted PurR-regulated permease PerM